MIKNINIIIVHQKIGYVLEESEMLAIFLLTLRTSESRIYS